MAVNKKKKIIKKKQPLTSKKIKTSKPIPKAVKKQGYNDEKIVQSPSFQKDSSNEKLNNRKLYYISSIIALGALIYFGRGLFVAATVNGKPVSRISLIKALEKENGKQMLDNLITRKLIIKEAADKNISITEQDIQEEIENINKSLESQGATLDEVLSMQGQDMNTLRESIKLQKMVEKMFGDDIKLTEEDIKNYYDENKSFIGEKSFDEVKENIKEQLLQQQITTKYQEWLTKAKSEAKINYFVKL